MGKALTIDSDICRAHAAIAMAGEAMVDQHRGKGCCPKSSRCTGRLLRHLIAHPGARISLSLPAGPADSIKHRLLGALLPSRGRDRHLQPRIVTTIAVALNPSDHQ